MLAVSSFLVGSDQDIQSASNAGIDCLECIFSKIAPWNELTLHSVMEYKEKVEYLGLKMYSAQSLFYGVPVSLEDPDGMIDHMERVIAYSRCVGINKLVFGSPSMRKKVDGWENKLKRFLLTVDNMLQGIDIDFLIEPNTRHYNSDFFYTVDEIVEYIKHNKLKKIKTMIDTHNLIFEDQNPSDVYVKYNKYISHVHVSEPGLKPIHDIEMHKDFSKQLKAFGYNNIITYECLTNVGVEVFKDIYG